jgi:DNA-binding transcriptional LysR family regulator
LPAVFVQDRSRAEPGPGGAGAYVVTTLVPNCAPDFAAAHPGVRLRILMDSPSEVARLVRTRALDLGVAEASVLEKDDNLEIVARLAPMVDV